MNFKYLTEIGASYNAEEGDSGHRLAALTQLETRLKQAIVDLRKIRRPLPPPPGSTARPLPTPPTYGPAAAKVERYRKWLMLQGATVKPDGSIDWRLSQRTVLYDRDLVRQGMTMLHVGGTRLYTDSSFTVALDTTNMVTHFSGPGKAIFVMSGEGNIHVSSHSVGHRHHSSLLAGAAVAAAGELEAKNGNLLWLSNKSGHYTPNTGHLLQVLHILQKRGVDMNFKLSVLGSGPRKDYNTVAEFMHELEMTDQPDYELMKLLSYSDHLDDAILARNGWQWRTDPMTQPAGVYKVVDKSMVPHKTVRQWLKAQGLNARVDTQSGLGR